jgi:photosystem II stability/assembly factor-like uncharacterized protein
LGWVALTNSTAADLAQYALARTTDGGHTWLQHALPLFRPDDVRASASAIYLQFLDSQTGWLVVKQVTGSNFSLGTLFRTEDGGDTWTELTIPLGEPVRFVTSTMGWTAGGPAGNELYQTQDGGKSWSAQTPASLSATQFQYLLPHFTDAQTGILPVVTTTAGRTQVEFHVTLDGGATWRKAAQVSLNLDATYAIPVSVIDSNHWIVVDPETQRLTRQSAEGATAIDPHFPAAAQLASLRMVSIDTGWALNTVNRCSRAPDTISGATVQTNGQCVQETQLLRTGNGGQDWAALPLPPTGATALSAANSFVIQSEPNRSTGGPGGPSIQAVGGLTRIFTGQGFDACFLPGMAGFQDWIAHSPYEAVNLYIGGSARYSACTAPTAAFVTQLSQQGWFFMPTWIGPQAACSGFASRMSADPATAYNQGVHEANAALGAASNLGFTLADGTGTVIYYDLEAFIGDQTCKQAAQSFVSGWSHQLHITGNQAGLYSTASLLNNFAGISTVPDVVWAAAYSYSDYQQNIDTGSIPYLNPSYWTNPQGTAHQRMWQYTGGHDETWGTTPPVNIDSDAINSVVAIPYGPAVSLQIYLPYGPLGDGSSPFRHFQVLVNGSDSRSSIVGYRLQVRQDNNPTPDTLTIVSNAARVAFDIVSPDDTQHTFSFQAQAWDQAGYQSPYAASGAVNQTVAALWPVGTDTSEPDNSPTQARLLTIGALAQTHNFHTLGDVDWVTMTLQAGNSYMIATDELGPGRFADTVITLYAPDHTTIIAQNDDAAGNWPASRLFWRPLTSGTYYLKVQHFDTYGYGYYTAYSLSAVQARQIFLPVVRR